MGELVNLNRYRKRQKRQADGAAAAENRVRHGTRAPNADAKPPNASARPPVSTAKNETPRRPKTAGTPTNRATPANPPPPPRLHISKMNLGLS